MSTKTRPTVRATFKAGPHENAKVPTSPMVGAGSLIARHRNEAGKLEMVEAVTVRTFYSASGNGMQPVRACVWIRAPRGSDNGQWHSGRGSAGGCGYHKESAAIAEAVSSAGVELYGRPSRYGRAEPGDTKRRLDFGGTGSSGYEEIFSAIAKARGFVGPFLWVSHGL